MMESRVGETRLRSASAEAGFTLVELMATLVVGAVVVLAMVRGMGAAHETTASARHHTQATQAARGAVESARSLGWTSIGHVPGATSADPNVVSGSFDPDDGGPLPSEPIVENGDGELDPYVHTLTYPGQSYTVRTYVTQMSNGAKRVTSLAEWDEEGYSRSTSVSTVVPPVIEDVGAAAFVLSGELPGVGTFDELGRVEADAGGGTSSDTVAVFDFNPVVDATGAGGASEASVMAGPAAHAEASLNSFSLSLPGLEITGTAIDVSADSSPGSMSATGSGSVTVGDGLTSQSFPAPVPGTVVNLSPYRVVLNDQRREADGSLSITYIRVIGPATELSVEWAWVAPSEFLYA